MKKQSRRKFSADFKAKVALEAIKNQQTLAELAVKFDVNPVMISKWKTEFLENMAAAFEKKGAAEKEGVDTQELYAQIGQLRVENEFLKKVARNWGYEDKGESGPTPVEGSIRSSAVRTIERAQKPAIL